MKQVVNLFILLLLLSNNTSAQWKASEGPFGGGVQDLYVDNNTIYACTSLGGIYVSTNEGSSWKCLTESMKSLNFYCVTKGGNKLYAGSTNGLFVSDNAGASWQILSSSLAGKGIYDVYVNGNTLVVSVINDGLYRSTDGGLTWVENNSNLFASRTFKFFQRETDFLILGLGGAYASSNLGLTWTSLNKNMLDSFLTCGAVKGSNIFVGTYSNGMYASTDNGNTWIRPTQPSASKNIRSVSFVGNRLFVAVDKELYYSDNLGQTWQACNGGISNAIVYCVEGVGSKLIAGVSNDAIYKSDNNGSSWTLANTGVMASLVRGLVQNNNYTFAVLPGGVMRSEDNGQTWISKSTGLPQANLNAITQSYGNLYVGTSGNGMYVSYNNGDTWAQRQSSLNNLLISKLISVDSILIAATDWGVYRSANLGVTWNLVDLPGNTNSISALEARGRVVYVGDFGGYLYRSEDAGVSFDLDEIRLTNAVNYINTFCITDSVTCFATAQGQVYLSNNNGLSWQQDGIGLPGKPINVLKAYQQSIVMGTVEGDVFISNNNGKYWNLATQNLGLRFVTSFLPLQDKLLAGGNGVWSIPLAQMPMSQVELNKNIKPLIFPNPTQGSFQIQFNNDNHLNNKICVIDMLGKVLYTIQSQESIIDINISDLPKGVYHLQIIGDKIQATQSLILH